MKDKNLSRITVLPLDKQAAERLGHIAWIEDGDPGRAIKAMVDAVAIRPVNCAVWTNSLDNELAALQSEIAEWRKGHELAFLSVDQTDRRGFPNLAMALAYLKANFNGQARPAEAFMGSRLTQLFRTAAVPAIELLFLAGADNLTLSYLDDHADDDPLRNTRLRFIESPGSQRTVIFANRDAELRANAKGRLVYRLRSTGPVDAWELPKCSFAVFTGAGHPHQPILHTTPFHRPGERPQRRTVMGYDVKMRY